MTKIGDTRGTPPITPIVPVGARPAQPDWMRRVAAKEKPKPKPARDEFVATGEKTAPQKSLTYDRSAWQKNPKITRDKDDAGNGSGLGDGNAGSHPTVSIYRDGRPVRRIFGRDDGEPSR